MSKRANRTSAPAARSRRSEDSSTVDHGSRARWLTRIAFGLTIAVVTARLLMSEAIRSATQVYPGSPNIPAGPGPSSGLLLDLLAGLCPLLVLLRRWVDPTFTLRWAWSGLLMIALGVWALISTAWAADRFAAIVSASHLLAAAGLLWAVAQIHRRPAHTRVVAGLGAGLLAVLLMHGLWYEFVERAELKKQWETNQTELLAARNIQPGTFEYIQFRNKVLQGELMGFSTSPNTYAAVLVMLGLLVIGVAIQQARDGRRVSAAAMVLLLLVTAGVLPLTQSRTAYVTAALGVGLLAFVAAFGPLLRPKATLLYVLGVIAMLGGIAFVIGYGVSRGTLFHDSINFRWRYWIGAFEVWQAHPLLGVGWENFGLNYLGVRIPEATEEIKDPHNFLVRFAAELGLIGGVLAVAWTAVTWWTITRPVAASTPSTDGTTSDADAMADDDDSSQRVLPIATVAGAAVAVVFGFVLNFFAAVDLSQDSGYVLFEGFRLSVYGGVAVVLASVVWMVMDRQGGESRLCTDNRPAPLIRSGLVVGLGMFFVANLIDFAMFEVGPMFLMALLLGAAIGAATPTTAPAATGNLAAATGTPLVAAAADVRRSPGRRAARMALAVGGAAWTLGAVLLVVPIVTSEAIAVEADAAFRRNVPALAAKGYESAFQNTVRNGDYAYRAAMAWRWANDPPRTKAMLDLAIEANPLDAGFRLARAELARSLQPPADQLAADDFAAAIKLDPNNREVRIRYADVLERLTLPREAAEQLKTALALNDRLTPEEKKRLSETKVAELQQRIKTLEGRR